MTVAWQAGKVVMENIAGKRILEIACGSAGKFAYVITKKRLISRHKA